MIVQGNHVTEESDYPVITVLQHIDGEMWNPLLLIQVLKHLSGFCYEYWLRL